MRPAQNFDALQVWQIGNLGGRARAVNAIDEHTHRRLDAGIVRAVAEAADDEVGVGGGLLLANAKRRHDGLQISQIDNLGLLDHALINNGHRHGHILQRLFALGGRDGDSLEGPALFFRRVLCDGRHGESGERGKARAEGERRFELRCTRYNKFSGFHVLVPLSKFLFLVWEEFFQLRCTT